MKEEKKIFFDHIKIFSHKNEGLVKEIHPLKHAYRLNGVVDVYKNGFCVHDIKNRVYHKFDKKADVFSMASSILKDNEQQSTFSSNGKNKNGITYQAFKKNMAKADWRPEQDKWNVMIDKTSDDYLYFVTDSTNRVKIGRSKNPNARVLSLNTGNPNKISLLLFVENKGCLEKELHLCFSDLKVHGEWFSYSDRIKDLMKIIRDDSRVKCECFVNLD